MVSVYPTNEHICANAGTYLQSAVNIWFKKGGGSPLMSSF